MDALRAFDVVILLIMAFGSITMVMSAVKNIRNSESIDATIDVLSASCFITVFFLHLCQVYLSMPIDVRVP